MTQHPYTWLWLAAVAAVLWLLRKVRGSFWFFSLLVFPGTCAHELCHWLMGWLLKGKPVRFTLWPKRVKGGYELGSVSFAHVRWYNAFFIGDAPLMLLFAAYGLVLWKLDGPLEFNWQHLVMVYLVANLIEGAWPSMQDYRVAARSPVGWLLLAAGLGYGWMWLRDQKQKPVPLIHKKS